MMNLTWVETDAFLCAGTLGCTLRILPPELVVKEALANQDQRADCESGMWLVEHAWDDGTFSTSQLSDIVPS